MRRTERSRGCTRSPAPSRRAAVARSGRALPSDARHVEPPARRRRRCRPARHPPCDGRRRRHSRRRRRHRRRRRAARRRALAGALQGYASALEVELSCSACAPRRRRRTLGNLSSCALLEEVQYMAGSHVDLLRSSRTTPAAAAARADAAGGEGGWPFLWRRASTHTDLGAHRLRVPRVLMLFEASTGEPSPSAPTTASPRAAPSSNFAAARAGIVGIATRRRLICPSRSAPSGTTYMSYGGGRRVARGNVLEVLDEAPHARRCTIPPPRRDGARAARRRSRQGQPVARGDAADAADANLRAAAAVAARAAVAAVARHAAANLLGWADWVLSDGAPAGSRASSNTTTAPANLLRTSYAPCVASRR